MNIITKTTLALKYLAGHYRRYIFLIMAVSFGFAIITTMTALSEGMYRNVYRAARKEENAVSKEKCSFYDPDRLFIQGFNSTYNGFIFLNQPHVSVLFVET